MARDPLGLGAGKSIARHHERATSKGVYPRIHSDGSLSKEGPDRVHED